MGGGTFKWGSSYYISAGWVESYGCVEANKVFINGGDIQYSKPIYGGFMRGTGDAINNEVTISGGTIGHTDDWISIYGAEVNCGSATGNKVNIDGGSFGKGCGFYGANLWVCQVKCVSFFYSKNFGTKIRYILPSVPLGCHP